MGYFGVQEGADAADGEMYVCMYCMDGWMEGKDGSLDRFGGLSVLFSSVCFVVFMFVFVEVVVGGWHYLVFFHVLA